MNVMHVFPEGEQVVGIVSHAGQVIVATNRHLYRMEQSEIGERLVPIRLEVLPPLDWNSRKTGRNSRKMGSEGS